MYWHLTFSTARRTRLWTTPADLDRLLRALARICGVRLLLFCLVDDHAHVVLHCDRPTAGAIARSYARALFNVGRAPLGPTHIRPVDGRAHLTDLVPYLIRQPVRHDLGVHPAAWPGSCFWDLVGLRVLPGFDPSAIRTALPRLDPARVWQAAALTRPEALELSALGGLGPPAVLDGARAALAAANAPRRAPIAVTARAVAVQLCHRAGLHPARIGEDLALPIRTVRALRAYPVPAPDRDLVTAHLAVRATVLRASPVAATDTERRAIARSRALTGAS